MRPNCAECQDITPELKVKGNNIHIQCPDCGIKTEFFKSEEEADIAWRKKQLSVINDKLSTLGFEQYMPPPKKRAGGRAKDHSLLYLNKAFTFVIFSETLEKMHAEMARFA